MSFDPDAYLASKRKGGGFDPDAYLAAKRAPAPSPAEQFAAAGVAPPPAREDKAQPFPAVDTPAMPQPKTGKVESLLRGAAQGLTLGFADELAGAVESALSGKTYRQARDESRAKHAAAKASNPKLYAGGEIGAGLASLAIPGVGLAKGAALGAAAGRAALTGAAAGLGASEAELTGPDRDLGTAFRDTAVGGIAGGIVGGAAGKLAKSIAQAPVRADNAALASLKEGVQNSTLVKEFGRRGANEPAIRKALDSDKPLKKLIRVEPREALDAVQKKVDALDDRLGSLYDRAQSVVGDIPLTDVTKAMDKVRAQWSKTSATLPLGKAVGKAAKNIQELHGEKAAISFQDLRQEVAAYAKTGFSSRPMFGAIPAAKELDRDVAMALREVLQEHVQKAASTAAGGGSLVDRKALQALNQEISSWIRVQNILDQKVTRMAVNAPTMKDLISKNAIVGVAKDAARKTGDVAAQAMAPIVRRAQKSPKVTAAGSTAADALVRLAGQTAPENPRRAVDALAGVNDDE